jgi:UDP-N-acetylmuramoyl-tripeptide--D-alanyl-D-alanine ligase
MRVPPFNVQEIVRATDGALVAGDLGVPVTGVSIDSRTLGVGEAFFAIRGERNDGQGYLADAAARGAACLVVQSVPDDPPANVPLILVDDTTRALGRLAARHRRRFRVPVVAVTGSNGKTTTKELIAAALGARWRVLKSAASYNNQWGLPLTLLKLGADHDAVVVEIGTNHPGEIAYLTGIAAPTVGVVTVVNAVHTEFLGSLDGVREEKAGLVRALPADGVAVLNADDARVASMARETRARVITYGRSGTAQVRAVGDIVDDDRGLAFTLAAGAERCAVVLALAGRHNMTNALAAAAAGVALAVLMQRRGPGAVR